MPLNLSFGPIADLAIGYMRPMRFDLGVHLQIKSSDWASVHNALTCLVIAVLSNRTG